MAECIDGLESPEQNAKIEGNPEILRNCIWYNPDISKNTLYFPDWYNKGIHLVSDIVDTDGQILSLMELSSKFNLKVNLLNYYTMKAKIQLFTSKYRHSRNSIIQRPIYPKHLDVVFKSTKGSRVFYQAYCKFEAQDCTPTCETAWANTLQYENLGITHEDTWRKSI